jgi:single-stranded-DNA-specific exonuclease
MPEPTRKRWGLPSDPCPPAWREGGAGLGLPGPVAQVLWNRGVCTPEAVHGFLEPNLASLGDPFLLSGMTAAVDRLGRALREKERVFVFGDFDADGIASSALAIGVLRALAGRRGSGPGGDAPEQAIRSISPDRKEGFGLTERVVRDVSDQGGRLLLTVDCGTSADRAIGVAVELGIDVVVADHHKRESAAPPVAVLVNPNLAGERYPFRDLAGVGVVHRLLDALTRENADEAAILRDHLDLVALGTVADVVPLRGENRVLTWHGLRRMGVGSRPAWSALADSCGLDLTWISSIDIAFKLAPRLNAPGRLGSPARAIGLLLAKTAAEARVLAATLENDNRERRDRHERVLKEALESVEGRPPGSAEPIILGSREWTAGVLGIVASRLMEKFQVPVVLVSLQGETARGSARTPPGHDLLAWLGGVSEYLERFGGHPQAAGVSMDPSKFDDFRRALLLRDAPRHEEAVQHIDGELDPAAGDLELARALERLAPFGAGNAEPLFLGHCVCRHPRVQRSRHLRFFAGDGNAAPDCIGFGMGRNSREVPRDGAPIEMLYLPTVNRHRGEEHLQLKLRALRPAPVAGPPVAPGDG